MDLHKFTDNPDESVAAASSLENLRWLRSRTKPPNNDFFDFFILESERISES